MCLFVIIIIMIMTFISFTTKAFFYWSPFTPLIVTSKNRFSMIRNCQQLKLKRDCRVANATSRLQQTHLQPCAGITCAGSRRTNVQPSPVQVNNRSPPVLGIICPVRLSNLPDIILFIWTKDGTVHLLLQIKLNYLYAWLSNVPQKIITFLPSQDL